MEGASSPFPPQKQNKNNRKQNKQETPASFNEFSLLIWRLKLKSQIARLCQLLSRNPFRWSPQQITCLDRVPKHIHGQIFGSLHYTSYTSRSEFWIKVIATFYLATIPGNYELERKFEAKIEQQQHQPRQTGGRVFIQFSRPKTVVLFHWTGKCQSGGATGSQINSTFTVMGNQLFDSVKFLQKVKTMTVALGYSFVWLLRFSRA